MSNTIKVKLSRSYTLAGKQADEISFREPKVADLIVIENIAKDAGENTVSALLMAQLSGATQPEIQEFSIPDFAACNRALRPFVSAGEDGESSPRGSATS